MNTKDIIKYAALAVAAYLVYKYLKESGVFRAAPVATAPSVTTQPPVTGTTAQPGEITAPVQTAAGQTPVMPLTTVLAQLKASPGWDANYAFVLGMAARGITSMSWAGLSFNPIDAVRAWGTRINSDNWNYYRTQAGGDVPNVDLFPPGNRDYKMNIDEYLAARASHGLSGLTGSLAVLAAMRAGNAWIV